MRSIILSILVLSMLFSSGCSFSVSEVGFVEKTQTSKTKIGLIGSDLMTQNALQDQTFSDKQREEESIKDAGIIIGVYYEKTF